MNTILCLTTRVARARPSRRRALVRSTLAMLATALGVAPALAQDAAYPSRPVSIVVPFAAGGSLDVTARILADRLKDVLGQPVLVVNRPGAGSSVGARSVGSAAPDGTTCSSRRVRRTASCICW